MARPWREPPVWAVDGGPAPAHPAASPVTTLAVAASTVAATASFSRVFASGGWVGPVVVTALVVHGAALALRSRRVGTWPALAVQLVALYLVASWAVVPSATTAGLPLLPAARALHDALAQASRAFPQSVAPVRPSPGFVLLAVVGTGTAAAVADWAALRVRRPLLSVSPAVALLSVCSLAGTAHHRAPTVVVVVIAALSSLLAQRLAGGGRPAWLGRPPPAAWASGLAGAAAAGCVAVLAASLALPGAGTVDGHGALGWRGGGPGGGSNRSVISPVVDLQTRLLEKSDTPVFTVTSPVPSYWRLTSLDTFTGVQWESTDTYHGVSDTLPGLQAEAAGRPVVTERFHIQTLSSIWMPTAFTPATVHGGGQVSWDPRSGSLLAASQTSNGLDYTMTSTEYLPAVTAASLAALPAAALDAGHTADLELPSSVPQSVYALAKSITAGARSEYAAALALQDYFVDDPRFAYDLHPPDDGYGTAALTDFLFNTRIGYCQQFAGAYAVLARASGLPTRLAVGFTTGTSTGPDRYEVTDADAHTWPEVWFGPHVGWLPFEPTKGGDFAIPGAAAYTGDTARRQAAATATVPTTVAPTAPTPITQHKVAASPTTPAPLPATTATVATRRSSPLPWVVAAAVLASVAWLLAGAAGWALRGRRRRRRVAAAAPEQRPAAEVLASWDGALDALALWDISRREDETPVEFARRAEHRLSEVFGPGATPGKVVVLAEAVTEAAYRPGPMAPEAAGAAAAAGAEVVQGLHAASSTSLRLRRLADPRRAWRDAAPLPA